jgi:hypothetical protein
MVNVAAKVAGKQPFAFAISTAGSPSAAAFCTHPSRPPGKHPKPQLQSQYCCNLSPATLTPGVKSNREFGRGDLA